MHRTDNCLRFHLQGAIGRASGVQLGALALFLWLASCPTPSAGDSGSEALFDGASLTGWSALGGVSWQVRDKAIHAAIGGKDGMLVSERSFADFHLSLEFHPDSEVNSGVFVRCQDRNDITPLTCYEVNIWDNHPNQDFRTGSIVARAYPPLAHLETIDQWNRFEIGAVGDRITVMTNGVKTAELQDASLASGFIALQRAEGGEVGFRNLRIQER